MARFFDRILRPFQRQATLPSRLVPPVVGIASGKGGTGKSMVTVNLAVLLGCPRAPVRILDADLGLGNAHLPLGLKPERNLQYFFEGHGPLGDLLQRSPYGVDVLPGGSGLSRLAHLRAPDFRRFALGLDPVLEGAAAVLVDSAAGISPQTLSFLLASDLVLIVTTPEITSLTDAYALIKCLSLRRPGKGVYLLVNHCDDAQQGRRAYEKIRDISSRFLGIHVSFMGAVPGDPAVRLALAARIPIVVRTPSSPAARGLRNCARKLQEVLEEIPRWRRVPSYGRRLLDAQH
ncbi:MAG TPA: MinD/ParA family protein [Planctomycetes bacterium]|nr:MinD/ParA family protein [Planctomycetota bacterium]